MNFLGRKWFLDLVKRAAHWQSFSLTLKTESRCAALPACCLPSDLSPPHAPPHPPRWAGFNITSKVLTDWKP